MVLFSVHFLESTRRLTFLQLPRFQQLIFAGLLLIHSAVVCQQVALGNEDSPNVRIQGSGLSHGDLNETVTYALNLCQIRNFLDGTRYRLLSSELQSEPQCHTKLASERFQATVYDYTHGRTLLVNGIPFDPTTVSTTEVNMQPFSNAEELDEAARIAGVGSRDNVVLSGMPPFVTRDSPDGNSQRILNIAVTSGNRSSSPVYVNMNNRTVESQPGPVEEILACEAPPAARASASGKGVPGTANLIISQGGRELWTFQAIRPSASSGTKGSAIELRNVKYKGKTVLYQAHVPILNVEYEQQNTGCGPYYRDWQFDEWPLQCEGTDLASGFRLCRSPAKTILDPPYTDGGNFAGVAVYVQGREVVLKAQLTAGWYRYVSEWRFHVDGTIRPRFGFGAVYQYPYCVCQVHHHHVYWRLDFDIGGPGNNMVREYNNPPIFGTSNYHDKMYEIRRSKDSSRQRHWEVSNTRSKETYALIPGSNDGTSDAYGAGDMWVLRYRFNEVDDGVANTGGSAAQTRANIDKFVNGEPVKDKDVVVWYGAHFKHDQTHSEGGSHVVGPDIRPLRW
jgi:Copper amine oxidase, enzyme domain